MRSILAFLLLTGVAHASDKCNDILRNGTYDVLITTSSHADSNVSNKWFCKRDFEEYVNSSKTKSKFNLVIDGTTLGFEDDNDRSNSLKTLHELCKEDFSDVKQADYVTFLQNKHNQVVINAWSKCMESHAMMRLVRFDYTTNSGLITLSAAYNAITGISEPTILSFRAYGDINCSDLQSFLPNTKITTLGLKEVCTKGKGASIVMLKTTLGDFDIQIKEDSTGQLVGSYVVQTEDLVVTTTPMYRVSKQWQWHARDWNDWNMQGLPHRPNVHSIDSVGLEKIEKPFIYIDPKVDDCKIAYTKWMDQSDSGWGKIEQDRWIGRPCDALFEGHKDGNHPLLTWYSPVPRIKSDDWQSWVELDVEWNRQFLVSRADLMFTYSAVKAKQESRVVYRYSDKNEISSGTSFNVVINHKNKKNAVIKFNMNGIVFDVSPREFTRGSGLKKLNQQISDNPNVDDKFTFIAE